MLQTRDGVCRLKKVEASAPGTLLKRPLDFAKAPSPPWLRCREGGGGQRGMETRRAMWDGEGEEKCAPGGAGGERWALGGIWGRHLVRRPWGLERSLGVWGLHGVGDSDAAGVRVEMESHR